MWAETGLPPGIGCAVWPAWWTRLHSSALTMDIAALENCCDTALDLFAPRRGARTCEVQAQRSSSACNPERRTRHLPQFQRDLCDGLWHLIE